MVSVGPLAIAFAVFGSAIAVVLILWGRGATDGGRRPAVPERTPFTGGREPRVHAWHRYHARYYPMALVFLAFDMEMVFMYPWAVVFRAEGIVAMIEMAMFIAILLLGVVYAWRERAYEWR